MVSYFIKDFIPLAYIDATAVIKATDNIIPIIVTIVLFLFNLRFLIVNLLSNVIIIPPKQFFHLQFLLSYQQLLLFPYYE